MPKLCKVCKVNKTERLMEIAPGQKIPVCTDCLTSGKYKEIEPAAPSRPKKPAKPKDKPATEGPGAYLCPKCKVTHQSGSKVFKRHLKLLNAEK